MDERRSSGAHGAGVIFGLLLFSPGDDYFSSLTEGDTGEIDQRFDARSPQYGRLVIVRGGVVGGDLQRFSKIR